jgi:hypothetical protein
MSEVEIEKLAQLTSEWMQERAAEVAEHRSVASFHWELKFSDLSRADAKVVWKAAFNAKMCSAYQAIYIISLLEPASANKVLAAYDAVRARKDGLAMARFPKDKNLGKHSCLYVGSSHKTPNRLLGHLGFGARTTYSLQMKSWAADIKDQGGVKIDVFGYDNIPATDLCALEDYLSLEQCQPIFGRRGSL